MNLNDKFIQKQKELLLQEKDKLESQIKKLAEYPDYGDFDEDNISELTDYENNLSIDDQLKILLNKVNNALLAIENGEYGLCKACRAEIESGRLEIMPYAELCVKCTENQK